MAPPGACAAEGERLVGVATEAGVWRRAGLYRQTWVSGANAHREPLRVEVEVTFDGQGTPGRRTYLVPAGGRWALSLDEVYGAVDGAQANATVLVRCDRACAATVALWHAPIGPGVVPTVYTVPMVCAGT